MVGVAAGGPLSVAVDQVIGDCDAGVFGVAGHNMLASDERCLSMLLAMIYNLNVLRRSI